jgi:hypothetical protein
MLGLGTFGKLVKGDLGPDEILEVLHAAGIEAEFSQVTDEAQRKAAFQHTAASLTARGAKTIEVKGRMRNGDAISALLTVVPCPNRS